ncbi:MAG TPA: hypothetical protein PKM12_04555, partial [Marmoricola sp.]|nr:hypothetical protein [Marmoricola sp.]
SAAAIVRRCNSTRRRIRAMMWLGFSGVAMPQKLGRKPEPCSGYPQVGQEAAFEPEPDELPELSEEEVEDDEDDDPDEIEDDEDDRESVR